MGSKTNKNRNSDQEDLAEGVRRKYLYRKMVMSQGVKLPARLAMKMVGPDCAYHLYSQYHGTKNESSKRSE